MTDKEVNYQNMAKQVLLVLTQYRPDWQQAYQKLTADYVALQTALADLDAAAQQRSGSSSRGYTEATDQAEVAALDAAAPVVQGLKALYQDGDHPDLGKVAKYTRNSLDKLRGPVQVTALEDVYEKASALKEELAEEMVTAKQLEALDKRITAYKPLVGSARAQTNAGSVLREATVQHLAEARKAIKRLDVRVPNLRAALPDLVAAYDKARQIVDAGHGPGKGDDLPGTGTPPNA